MYVELKFNWKVLTFIIYNKIHQIIRIIVIPIYHEFWINVSLSLSCNSNYLYKRNIEMPFLCHIQHADVDVNFYINCTTCHNLNNNIFYLKINNIRIIIMYYLIYFYNNNLIASVLLRCLYSKLNNFVQ